MADPDVTLDQSWTYRRKDRGPIRGAVPGVLVLFSGAKPEFMPIRLGKGAQVFGRDGITREYVKDSRMSRRHAEVSFEGGSWRVRDLGSRNGTFLDAVQVNNEEVTQSSRVLRVGDTLFGLLSDVRPYEGSVVQLADGVVLGPTLRAPWAEIERAARGRVLHLTGESGSGKELAARHFHRLAGGDKAPFVAVNCATIPHNLAERLLFGARKGAYSGAEANADGYLQAASGGTLFLDEIAELEPQVQAKLLRVLETKEVLPLGATKPMTVDFAICSATHRDLRERVTAGSFRSDLFFRIGAPTVALPALRERIEDIPWIIQGQLQKHGNLGPHVSLVEACLSRYWPGNVRELLNQIDGAAGRAEAASRARVEGLDLLPTAGLNLEQPSAESAETPPDDAAILKTLREENGNVARSARILGLHRNQLRRWLTKNREQVKSLTIDSDED